MRLLAPQPGERGSAVMLEMRGNGMTAEIDIEFFLDTIVKEGPYSTRNNLRFHLDTLFERIDFRNKMVLDIGGGYGLLSFYASYRGARGVSCLEPEADGSSPHVIEKFHKINSLLECRNVRLQAATFQAYEAGEQAFDIVILYNSINHLDEDACIDLLENEASRLAYKEIFSKLHSLLNPGGKVLICDCSRYNFFDLLKIRNPFAPKIEWHKHQSPRVWIGLLGEAGFTNPRVRWSSFNRLRHFGKFLLGNELIAYFFNSHFCLTVDRP
jgi:SAM-dependent methyltransferase